MNKEQLVRMLVKLSDELFCNDEGAGVLKAADMVEQALEGYAIVPVEDCPNCPNQGWYAQPNNHTGEPEQVQCEFCETVRHSRYNIDLMLTAWEQGDNSNE